jgi:LysM repeat protein
MLAGCGKSGAQLDSADEKDARVRKGLELVQQKKLTEAVKQFETALAKKPDLGRPDLELALISEREKNNARAIYHYERYLEKRPLTEKRALIQEWIQQAKISLSEEAGGNHAEELARLTQENSMLRKQLERASAAPAVLATTLPTDPPQAVAKPAAPAKPSRTYTVRPGDTLSRIAGAVYGDTTRWKKIYEANRDQMKHESDLKVGQTLVIPNR